MVDIEGNIQRMDESGGQAESPKNSTAELSSEPKPPDHYSNQEYQDIFPEPSEVGVAESVQPEAPSDPFAEIQNFANSDLPTSPLSYTLIVEGIDRGELRKEFSEIIRDEKFKLDVHEVLKKIKNGRIELEGLNAVKASVLVLRLRALPLQISWRQHAYQA
jgi:hypothetical protein